MSEDTKLFLGHILYRVKEMIRALIEDGDWPFMQMPSDNIIAQALIDGVMDILMPPRGKNLR